MVKNIMVAISGGELDEELMEVSCNLAKKQKARLYLVYIIEVPRTLPLDANLTKETGRGEEALGRAETWAEKTGCRVETEILQSRQAGATLVDEAIEREVDLLILGAPYRTGISGDFDLGHTATYVVKNAPCQVMIWRGKKGEEQ